MVAGIVRGLGPQALYAEGSWVGLGEIVSGFRITDFLVRFTGLKPLSIIFDHLEKGGAFEGASFLAGFNPIFRRIGWETFVSPGSLVGVLFFGERGRSAFALPLFVESFLLWGLTGVIIGSCLFGFLIRYLYRYVERYEGSFVMILYSVLCFYIIYGILAAGYVVLFDLQFIFLLLISVVLIKLVQLRIAIT
jgi:hypothetical protein